MAVHKKTTSAIVAASLLIIALCAATFAAIAPSAKADGVICPNKDELGAGFGPYNWKTFTMTPLPDAPNRVWTLQESFGGSAHFVNYEGEGKGDHTFVRDVGEDRGKKQPQWSKNIGKLKSERSMQKCTMDSAMVHIGDLYLRAANILTAFTTFVATKSFDPSFICRKPGQGGCVDILSVIGGKSGGVVTNGKGGGIVGALTSGLYLPLIILVVAISAFVVIRQGIIHHQIRTALGSTLWILGCMTIGLMFLFSPQMLAKAPMTASNSLVSCVVGSFNGVNCFDSSPGASDLTDADSSSSVCASIADGSLADKASMSINSLGCSIWKAFVLEPYSQGNFGQSFDDLDADNKAVSNAIKKAGYKKEDFCTDLGSVKSYNSENPGGNLVLNKPSNKVCNLAAYQLYLQTKADAQPGKKGPNGPTPSKGGTGGDQRWYKLILTVASDDGMWEHWSSVGGKHMQGLLAMLTAGLGGVLIVVTSLAALMFYLISVIVIAFAPLFLLVGVYPGRGKKIMLGWGETCISNLLKYLMSALFLLVSISLYAGVLGNADNIIISFLFVIILTLALKVYRKEILNLLGQINLGGERLSSAMGDRLRQKGLQAKQFTGGVAKGGAGVVAAGAVAGHKSRKMAKANAVAANPKRKGMSKAEIKDRKSTIKDAKKSAMQQSKKQRRSAMGAEMRKHLSSAGDVGNAFATAAETMDTSNRSQLNRFESDYDKKFSEAKEHAQEAQERFDRAVASNEIAERNAEKFYASNPKIKSAVDREMTLRAHENGAVEALRGSFPEYAKMQELVNSMQRLKMNRTMANAQGDANAVSILDKRIAQKQSQIDKIKFTPGIDNQIIKGQELYRARVEKASKADGSHVAASLRNNGAALSVVSNAEHPKWAARNNIAEAQKNLTDAKRAMAGAAAASSVVGRGIAKFSQGEIVSSAQTQKILSDAEKAFVAAMAGVTGAAAATRQWDPDSRERTDGYGSEYTEPYQQEEIEGRRAIHGNNGEQSQEPPIESNNRKQEKMPPAPQRKPIEPRENEIPHEESIDSHHEERHDSNAKSGGGELWNTYRENTRNNPRPEEQQPRSQNNSRQQNTTQQSQEKPRQTDHPHTHNNDRKEESQKSTAIPVPPAPQSEKRETRPLEKAFQREKAPQLDSNQSNVRDKKPGVKRERPVPTPQQKKPIVDKPRKNSTAKPQGGRGKVPLRQQRGIPIRPNPRFNKKR